MFSASLKLLAVVKEKTVIILQQDLTIQYYMWLDLLHIVPKGNW